MSYITEELKRDDSKEGATLKVVNQAKIKMDLPFDLNNLFNMNYSFDILKQAIEYLAMQQA